MLEPLPPSRYSELLPLNGTGETAFPIVAAVLEGRQRGQVLGAADGAGPALVVNHFGFMRLLEEQPDPAFDAGLTQLFAEPAQLPSRYLLWYDPPGRWQERLDRIGDRVRRRERMRFAFSREAYGRAEEEPLPPGFAIAAMDAASFPKAGKFGLDLGGRFWASPDDFLTNAMPICVLHEGEIASLCYAAAVGGRAAEVDVVTDPAFAGLGLATAAARRFMHTSLARGITPAWDCFTYNEGSMRLAGKLGFVPHRTYAFYTFNIPVALAKTGG
jgi:RimJ/RimL family protein N-acetyltransferase